MQVDFELADLDPIEGLYREQRVDEKPVAARGGNPSRRGMRARDEAELREVGHHIADRGRTQVQPREARQRARADRLAFGDIALDQGLEQDLRATVQHRSRFYRIGSICGFAREISHGLFVTCAWSCFNGGMSAFKTIALIGRY